MASVEEDDELTDTKDTATDNKETEDIILPVSKKCKGIVKDPNFAVVCSFIHIFGPLLRFQELSIATVEHFFDSTPSQGNQEDVETFFIKLLRKIGKNVVPGKWEKSLLKLAREFDITLAWDLEQFGFHQLPSEGKLALLKYLFESQFDKNDKFKSAVNSEMGQEALRPKPLGSDIDGLIYWFHEDSFLQVRLYITEEDELDCEAWKVLACDLDEIMNVVEYLEKKSVSNPKDFAKVKREEKRKKYILEKKTAKPKTKKKRGRKSRKEPESSDDNENGVENEISDEDDDDPCARCYSGVHPEWILLCDKCDAAYHTACLRPPLMQVPAGNWFCPYCNTLSLIDTLKEIHSRISTRVKARSRAANRQNANGINLSNIRQSGRVRKTVDYTFADFDQEILDAVGKKHQGYDNISQAVSVGNVGQTYTSGSRSTRLSKRRKIYDSDNDSDSKDSNYEFPEEKEQPVLRKNPPRHVYLRRHEVDDGSSNEDDQDEKGKKGEQIESIRNEDDLDSDCDVEPLVEDKSDKKDDVSISPGGSTNHEDDSLDDYQEEKENNTEESEKNQNKGELQLDGDVETVIINKSDMSDIKDNVTLSPHGGINHKRETDDLADYCENGSCVNDQKEHYSDISLHFHQSKGNESDSTKLNKELTKTSLTHISEIMTSDPGHAVKQ